MTLPIKIITTVVKI